MARREWQNPRVLTRDGKAGPVYYVRYRVKVLDINVDGKREMKRVEKWHELGLCSEMTKRQAERRKDEIMREVNGQVYTIQSHVPFIEFLAVYKHEHYRGLKETSRRYYDARLSAWIIPAFKDKKLYQIGALEISQLMGAMERAKVARSTRTATRALLANIFEWARRWGYLKEPINPARDAEVGRSDDGARTIWTPTFEEARAIVNAADEHIALMLEVITWTGMRISEVLGMRCKNVDVDQAVLYVRERNVRRDMDTPKSRAGQRPLPLGYLAEKLRPLMAGPEDFIFRQENGEAWTDQLLYRRIRAAMDAAEMYHTGNAWHAFRRLHLTLMSRNMSLFDLRAQAGHTDVRTTQRYVQSEIGTRADALRSAQGKVVPFKRRA